MLDCGETTAGSRPLPEGVDDMALAPCEPSLDPVIRSVAVADVGSSGS